MNHFRSDIPRVRVLFVLKQGHDYWCGYSHSSASGLRNSARFVARMLLHHGIEARVVEVNDNNDIDREVADFQPDFVIVEALWVVPEKFDELSTLHPQVRWIVRCHSDWTFLATEGIALEWIRGYIMRPTVSVAFNSPHVVRDFKDLFRNWQDKHRVIYLPNYYPVVNVQRQRHLHSQLRVGTFGAIRPMKNQLIQAVAAVRYADLIGKQLRFYVNSTRCEQLGNNVLKNLQALFAGTHHELIEIPWIEDHDYFLVLMSMMDISLAVSLSETFCITAADAVICGVPLICSEEVPWASRMSIVDSNDSDEIVAKMGELRGTRGRMAQYFNRSNLARYSEQAKGTWMRYLKG